MGLLDNSLGSKPSSEDQFAQMLIDGIRRAGETGEVQYDAEEFMPTAPQRTILNLADAYREYCSAQHDIRQEVFQKWVRAWFITEKPIPEDYEDIRPDLLPAVRGQGLFRVAELQLVASGSAGER